MIATVTLNPSLDEWVRLSALRVGRLNRASAIARYPGGKGINVSRVIHELGGSTVAFGLAGGEDGLILRERLNRLRLRHVFVEVAGATRNNYKIRTEHPRALTELNTAGPRVSAASLRRLARRLAQVRPRPVHVALCGSLPPGAPPTIYRDWIRALQRRGIPVALDASGEALRHGLIARPWLMKPNREEAAVLLGRALTTRRRCVRAVRELVRRGVEVAMLSLGREGALLACRQGGGADETVVWHGVAPPVRVEAAVGAGDSLVGGFLAGWVQDRDFLAAFRLGIACGAATAMAPGTELCHRRDVARLLPRVTTRRLA